MTSFVFIIGIIFGLRFVSFLCEGAIRLPPGGDRLIVAPGDNVTIAWTFNDTILPLIHRLWRFRNSSQSSSREIISEILGNSEPIIHNSSLPRVEIEKPATLILRNVDHSYDGIYQFEIVNLLSRGDAGSISHVRLFVAVKPTVAVCSSPIGVEEGGDVSCLCRRQGAPTVTSVSSCPTQAVLGESFTITCEASAHPSPSYTIIHNGTDTVSNDKTYVIITVKHNHAGSYQCIAKNKLGHSSRIFNLSVTTSDSGESEPDSSKSFVAWLVVVFLLSGFIIGVLLSSIVLTVYFRRRYGNKNPAQSNPEPQTTSKVVSIYQDLDLNKMNEDENYQSLQGAANSGSNDPESNYETIETDYT